MFIQQGSGKKISICTIGATATFMVAFLVLFLGLSALRLRESNDRYDLQRELLERKAEQFYQILEMNLNEVSVVSKTLALSDEWSRDETDFWIGRHLAPLGYKERTSEESVFAVLYENQKPRMSYRAIEGFQTDDELNNNSLVKEGLNGREVSSLTVVGGTLYAIAVSPLYPIGKQDLFGGVIILGRAINGAVLNYYKNLLDSDFVLVTPATARRPPSSANEFYPPPFEDSVRAAATTNLVRFDDIISIPRAIKNTEGSVVAVVWILSNIKPLLLGGWLSGLDSSAIIALSSSLAAGLAMLAYLFLLFSVRRPVRRALYRMSTDPVQINEDDLDSSVDEIRSLKKAVRRLQNAVFQSKEVRKTILHSMNEGFQLMDTNGKTLEVNQALCNLAGIGHEKFIKDPTPFFYLNEEGRELALEFIELVKKGEGNLKRGFETELSWADNGNKNVRVRLCTVEDEDALEPKICVFVAGHDSESNAHFDIHELGKMTLLVKFAGTIAHNMNNILSGILSAVSLFERNKLSDENRVQILKSMRDGITKGTGLCAELLQMSKVRQVRNTRRPVDIRAIALDVARMASELQEAKVHEIRVIAPQSPVLALCEDSGFHHVLLNLVLNSIDAMSGPGTVQIAIEEDLTDPNAAVFVRVVDTGSGISPEVQKLMFSPFFTTKKNRSRKKTFGGSGIGLASALESVQSWGGSIECDSTLGHGTTFTIKLQPATRSGSSDETDLALHTNKS